MAQAPHDLPLILGTAGHIDHGKSSLIKLLTGTDPDRLKEEKSRGITIELGFAELTLPSGRTMGVVDVPGHERFVRQMIAGATGIDLALLVIAADDGVMPQTREHTAIMELLGIRHVVVALTKADLVDQDWLELAQADVEEFLQRTAYANAPIVPCSSATGAGKDELLATLDAVAAHIDQARMTNLPLRLPCDRVFTLKGVGTVVTGTLWSGTVSPDDEVALYPSGKTCRVRSVQVHSQPVERAYPGQRTALNLVGVEKSEVPHGTTVAEPGSLLERTHFDALITYLGKPGSDAPFVSGARVHLNHGTTEVLGRILLCDEQPELAVNAQAFAQIRLEEPLAIRAHDRFIVRSYSPVSLIGGGVALFCDPPRRTRLSDNDVALLNAQRDGDAQAAVVAYVKGQTLPKSSAEIAAALDLSVKDVSQIADRLKGKEFVALATSAKPVFASEETLAHLLSRIEHGLLAFHKAEPLKEGISTAALRDRVDARLAPHVFDALLAQAEKAGTVFLGKGLVSHKQAGQGAKVALEAVQKTLMRLLEASGLNAPFSDELFKQAGVSPKQGKDALRALLDQGKIVRITLEYHVTAPVFEAAKKTVVDHIEKNGPTTTSELREALGTSRKYALPFLGALDEKNVTVREEDVRRLR